MNESKKVIIFVNSDYYVQIRPDALPGIREVAQSPNKVAFYPFTKNKPHWETTSSLSNVIQMSALQYIRYNYLEVYEMVSKAIKIVESTEEYVEYSLLKAFSEKKHYGTPPGSVRFYSQNLICFFNGKNWRKLTP